MDTRNLRTILTSAYLSAMLASSVAPMRSDATLASTIDPRAAQKALETAFSGLSIDGWNVSSISALAPVAQAMPAGSPVNPSANPVMNEELMGRLVTRALASTKDSSLGRITSEKFGLNDGKTDLPAKQIGMILPDGKHVFLVPMKEGSKDIVIFFRRENSMDAYLTDKTGILRDAVYLDRTSISRIPKEQAYAKYNAELTMFAVEAAALPPAGTAVASR